MRALHVLGLMTIAVLLHAGPARAQWVDGPVRLFDGRVRLAGEISATIGERDDEAFFNFTDYEQNALRTFRIGLTGVWQPAARVAILAEIRTQDLDQVSASAAYIRVRPWAHVPLDIQAGRIPPVFGSFARRTYESDRLLIGYPLAYQYLTSLRPDALPLEADDLLRMRGRGWRSSFPVGAYYEGPGVPLVSSFRWDTGVQARWTSPSIEAAAALTQGTLSNPRTTDDNDSKQVSGRLAVRPRPGLVFGGSAARGGWISADVPVSSEGTTQVALGADAEYSAGHWLVRAETVWSRWTIPFARPPVEGDAVSAVAAWIEGRYRVTPRIYVAARGDRLGFSRVSGTLLGGGPTPWDAGVRRFEIGAGYSLQRNLVLRGAVQANWRDGGRVGRRTFLSTQVAWWF